MHVRKLHQPEKVSASTLVPLKGGHPPCSRRMRHPACAAKSPRESRNTVGYVILAQIGGRVGVVLLLLSGVIVYPHGRSRYFSLHGPATFDRDISEQEPWQLIAMLGVIPVRVHGLNQNPPIDAA